MTDGADPRAQQRVGTVLNEKWTLEHLIGSGGMGAVYAGRHRNGARAAVKVLHPELARISEVRERFLREGYAANSVEHRGAVQVLDDDIVKTGPDEGSAYLVMELLEGESLQERVLRGPKLTERELLEVMDAVLDVLAAAHEHGVVHRDLKPENIFLANDPEREGVRVKVLDFGLARLAEASTVTSAGIAVGTPSFMSPEQAAGRSDEIDGRTDIFALGATIFRIVTGRRIHDAENMVQLVILMATVPAPRIRTITPTLSEAFARIIDRSLRFERDDRYPDAATMRADVRVELELTARAATASFVVIPFSARNVRVGSFSSFADIPPPDAPAGAVGAGDDAHHGARENHDHAHAPKPDADDDYDDDASSNKKEPSYVYDESESFHRGRAITRSATLPWLIVLFLLAIGAWKLGPSVQGELVRRASLPVRELWSASSSSTNAPSSSASTTSAQTDKPAVDNTEAADASSDASLAAAAVDDAASTDASDDGSSLVAIDVDDDAGPLETDQLVDAAGLPQTDEGVHDAGARATATRPHVPSSPHTGKPPTRKPTPPPRKRRH